MYWIVTELFYPDEVSTAYILTDIAIEKSKREKVGVICGPVGYESSYSSQPSDLLPQISIHRVSLPALNKNNLYQRVIRLLFLSLKLSWKVLTKVKKGDTVFFTTNPTFLTLILPSVGILKRFKVELLVHDVFPENLVPAGLIKKESYKFQLLSTMYNWGYKNVDRIVVIGQDMRLLIQSKVGSSFKRIDTIPNWSDSNIAPKNDFDIGRYLCINVENKLILSFTGNLGRVQGLVDFIEVFKKADNKNLILLIIGDGAFKELIINKIRNDGIDNIIYLGPKPRAEQNLFLNACHISLVTLISGMKGLGVPSKTYNYLAAGRPVLFVGDNESEVDNYITNYDCGWSFSWAEENKLIDFMRELSFSHKINEIVNKGERAFSLSGNFKKEKLLKLF